MAAVRCVRGSGSPEMTPIMEPLAGVDAALIERGRGEIDRASPALSVQADCPWDPAVQRGQVVRLVDTETGHPLVGVVEAVSVVPEAKDGIVVGVSMRLSLWCPEESNSGQN